MPGSLWSTHNGTMIVVVGIDRWVHDPVHDLEYRLFLAIAAADGHARVTTHSDMYFSQYQNMHTTKRLL
jgi:hypothetical protein